MKRTSNTRRSGVSIFEVVLVASILVLLTRALIETSESMGRVSSSGNTQTVLQQQGEKALRSIITDLRRSGFRLGLNGKDFPSVFDDGTATLPFTAHTHPLAVQEAVAGDDDFGNFREIILVQPSDLDGDGRPDMDIDFNGVPELDGNGDGQLTDDVSDTAGLWNDMENTIDGDTGVVWSHDEISYVVVTRPDGVNYLERRIDGDPTTAKRIAHGVELVQFDTPESSFWTLPLNTVRVRIFFRMRDKAGMLYTHAAEVVVSLRNSGEI